MGSKMKILHHSDISFSLALSQMAPGVHIPCIMMGLDTVLYLPLSEMGMCL